LQSPPRRSWRHHLQSVAGLRSGHSLSRSMGKTTCSSRKR
jgi:hypothetical protein